MSNLSEKQDAFLSCIYDARQGLITRDLQLADPADLAKALGDQWTYFTFQHMVDEGFISPGRPHATMTDRGAKLLLLATGVPPLAPASVYEEGFQLADDVRAVIGDEADQVSHHAKFRVLTMGSPKSGDPVAVHHTCLGHPGPAEIEELAAIGLKILAHGDYAVAFSPQQGLHTTELIVYSKPGKAPRTDLAHDKVVRVLKGLEKL